MLFSLRLVSWTIALGMSVLACGGQASDFGGETGGTGGAGAATSGGAASGGRVGGPSGGVTGVGGMPGNISKYQDPVCAEQPKPKPELLCDIFKTTDKTRGCEPGMACYPFLLYASDANGCGQEVLGSECRRAGELPEGAQCGEQLGRCAPGHICVIGNRPGKRCVPICSLKAPGDCKNGLLCVETDLEGIGACG